MFPSGEGSRAAGSTLSALLRVRSYHYPAVEVDAGADTHLEVLEDILVGDLRYPDTASMMITTGDCK